MSLIEVIVPPEPMTAVAAAETTLVESFSLIRLEIVTVGFVVYPLPTLVKFKAVIVPAVPIVAVAVAVVPTPIGPLIVTVGAVL